MRHFSATDRTPPPKPLTSDVVVFSHDPDSKGNDTAPARMLIRTLRL